MKPSSAQAYVVADQTACAVLDGDPALREGCTPSQRFAQRHCAAHSQRLEATGWPVKYRCLSLNSGPRPRSTGEFRRYCPTNKMVRKGVCTLSGLLSATHGGVVSPIWSQFASLGVGLAVRGGLSTCWWDL